MPCKYGGILKLPRIPVEKDVCPRSREDLLPVGSRGGVEGSEEGGQRPDEKSKQIFATYWPISPICMRRPGLVRQRRYIGLPTEVFDRLSACVNLIHNNDGLPDSSSLSPLRTFFPVPSATRSVARRLSSRQPPPPPPCTAISIYSAASYPRFPKRQGGNPNGRIWWERAANGSSGRMLTASREVKAIFGTRSSVYCASFVYGTITLISVSYLRIGGGV